jgi:hypothetical protein
MIVSELFNEAITTQTASINPRTKKLYTSDDFADGVDELGRVEPTWNDTTKADTTKADTANTPYLPKTPNKGIRPLNRTPAATTGYKSTTYNVPTSNMPNMSTPAFTTKAASVAAPAATPAVEPGAGAGVFGNMASQLASRPTASSTGGTTTGVSGVGNGVVRHTSNPNNPNIKPAATTTAAATTPVKQRTGGRVAGAEPSQTLNAIRKRDARKRARATGSQAADKTWTASTAQTSQRPAFNPKIMKQIVDMVRRAKTARDFDKVKTYVNTQFPAKMTEAQRNFRKALLEQITLVGAIKRRMV